MNGSVKNYIRLAEISLRNYGGKVFDDKKGEIVDADITDTMKAGYKSNFINALISLRDLLKENEVNDDDLRKYHDLVKIAKREGLIDRDFC
jgi:hypothetical protein